MNVWTSRAATDDAPTCAVAEPHEHAEPAWGPGQRSFAWSPDGAALAWSATRTASAGWSIVAPGRRCAAPSCRRAGTAASTGARGGIACVRSGGRTPPQVVVLAATGRAARRVAAARRRARGAGLVEPSRSRGRADGATVHGLLWLPRRRCRRRPRGRAAAARDVHGGPTGQAPADWKPRVQCFVVARLGGARPNYRGLDRPRPRYSAGARHALGRASTSPTPSPGSAHAVEGGLGRRRRVSR